VQSGTRYHDGRPGESGKSWWGTVTGFQPSGSIDFHHTITVKQLRAKVEVHNHYSFEPDGGNEQRTRVNRWLLLDIGTPLVLRPVKLLITSKENVQTIAAVKKCAEDHPDLDPVQHPPSPSR
jgi:hypothetical protein